MVLSEVVNTQYAFPVGIVLICAILVFVFGFKSAEQPAFDQLTTYTGDDRKPAGKKRKLKDKKSQSNGHATAVGDNHAEVKTNSTKSVGKSEKSPLKEVSNKVVTKQVKKQESSPIKDKSLGKHKDNKKELQSTPKQLKDKKQAAEKSPVKDNKNVAAKPKGKGKENQVEDLKNKKNEKNLAKLKKADDGGWKQVLSSKDKKNRKKDEPEIEYIVPEKNAGKMEETPKKKKAKNIELVIADIPATMENREIEEGKTIEKVEPKNPEKVKKAKQAEKKVDELEKNGEESEKSEKKSEKKAEKGFEKKKSEKQSEKKKKVEQESKGEKEVDEKASKPEKAKSIEEILIAEVKSSVELSPDTAAKAKKKNKKKADNKQDAAAEIIEDPAPKKLSESSENADSNRKVKPVEVKMANLLESKVGLTTTVVFDELGDTWKEAKVPKKNKKKVRKDQ